MRKPGTGMSSDPSKGRIEARQKKEKVAEAGLKARKAKATKAIAIGSAALSIITLSLFTFNKIKKKKKGFFF